MNVSFNMLRCKEVINVCDGCRLGYIDDIILDVNTGTVCEVEIPLRRRFFSFIPRSERITVPWNCIERIGDDIIIVSIDINAHKKETKGFGDSFIKWLSR